MQGAQALLIPGATAATPAKASSKTVAASDNAPFNALLATGGEPEPGEQQDNIAQVLLDGLGGEGLSVFADLPSDPSLTAVDAQTAAAAAAETVVANLAIGAANQVVPPAPVGATQPIFSAEAAPQSTSQAPVGTSPAQVALTPQTSSAFTATPVSGPTASTEGAAAVSVQGPATTQPIPVLSATAGASDGDLSADLPVPLAERTQGTQTAANTLIANAKGNAGGQGVSSTAQVVPTGTPPQPLQTASTQAQVTASATPQQAVAPTDPVVQSTLQTNTAAATTEVARPVFRPDARVNGKAADKSTPVSNVLSGVNAQTTTPVETRVAPQQSVPTVDPAPAAGEGEADLFQAKTPLRPDATPFAAVKPEAKGTPSVAQAVLPAESTATESLSETLNRTPLEGPTTPSNTSREAQAVTGATLPGAKPSLSKPFSEALMLQVKSAEIVDGKTSVQLRPHGLGSIDVEVISGETEVASKIVVRVENPVILQHLREDRDLLAQTLGVSDGTVFEFEHHDAEQHESGNKDGSGNFASGVSDGLTSDVESIHADIVTDERIDIMT